MRRLKFIILTVCTKSCWFFLWLPAVCGFADAQVAPLNFSHFTLDNNLFAHTLMRDSKGFLWIGSDGLFRYDGIGTRHFIHDPKNSNSLVNNSVKSIAEGKKGRIWIGTIKGISCYDPGTDSFTNYEYDSNDPKSPELFDNVLHVDADSTVWVGNQSGIGRYNEHAGSFTFYNIGKYQSAGHKRGRFINHIIDDKKDKQWLWLSSYDGLIHFNKKTGFAKYFYPPGDPITINQVFQDSHQFIWLATWGRGVGIFNEVGGSFKFFPFEKNVHLGADNIAFNIQEHLISKDSSLFFVSTNDGLALLNLHNATTVQYPFFYTHRPDDTKSIGGMPSETLVDKQGITWVATGNDVSYILPSAQVFRQVNSTHYSHALINTITEENLPGGHHQYWLSCWYTEGLLLCDENFRFKKQVVLPNGYGISVNARQINQMVIDSAANVMWIATMDGLYKWQRSSNRIIAFKPDKATPYSLPSEQVMTILPDHQKRLWIGTYRHGLCVLNTINSTFVKLPEHIHTLLKDKRILCLYEDRKNRIWVGCAATLLCLNEKDNTWQVYNHQKNSLSSKAEGDVNGIVEDKTGRIWVGNDGGLNRFAEATHDFSLFTTIDGLSNDQIYSLVCDKAGIVWIGTPSGLNSIDPATNTIKNYYEKDGLSTNDVSNAIFIKKNNEIVIAGDSGSVTLFDPSKLYRNTAPPPVYITALKLFNKTDNKQSYFPLPKELHLTYNQNYFSIDFIALNLMNAGDNRYAYQLIGLDKDWIPGGTEHNATYSNLSAGKYIFKVEASNNDGVWNRHGASLIVVISPPFWQTWWFITLCIIAIFLFIYSIYRYRLEQLLQVERLRTKISTDLHDDIGSTLSSISILSELVLNKKDNTKANEMLNEIKDNAISLMEKMDDIVWSINPRNDSLEDLLSRISRFASQLFEAKNIDHTICIQPNIRELKLPMEVRQHLYLMLKESINNIIKHACCSKAHITATCKDHLLTVAVEDNGKGFKTTKTSTGNGLMNLKERAIRMGASVQINSAPNEGTKVTISIKIK